MLNTTHAAEGTRAMNQSDEIHRLKMELAKALSDRDAAVLQARRAQRATNVAAAVGEAAEKARDELIITAERLCDAVTLLDAERKCAAEVRSARIIIDTARKGQ